MNVIQEFEQYAKIEAREDRRVYGFENPALLSRPSLWTIYDHLKENHREAQESPFFQYLEELNGARMTLARNPDAYPLGVGPVERLAERYERGEVSISEAIEIAGSAEYASLISPVYVHAIVWQSLRLAKTTEWERAVYFGRLVAEAAIEETSNKEVNEDLVNTITGFTQIALLACSRAPDDSIFNEAVGLLQRLLDGYSAQADPTFEGNLLHTLGTLYSDSSPSYRCSSQTSHQTTWANGLIAPKFKSCSLTMSRSRLLSRNRKPHLSKR